MHPIPRSCLLATTLVMLLAGEDPSWKNKPIPQWSEQDAKLLLTDSPWVKKVQLDQVRNLSKYERRDGGNWEAGIGPTVGFGGIGLLGPTRAAMAIARAHVRPDLGTVMVRWESANPVRAAELKAGETEIPKKWMGDYYAIAVYDVVPPFHFNLARELQGDAFLSRDKKKDLRPERVEILYHGDGSMTAVYLFSRSAEITKKDRNVRFVAQIGRLWIAQFFFPEEMEFAGNPEF
jgi:hypothetical protein